MPKGYILAEVTVTDPALFETYRPLAAASIAAFGGKYLVRGGAAEMLEGERTPGRMVLLEFSSPERAMEWYQLGTIPGSADDPVEGGEHRGAAADRARRVGSASVHLRPNHEAGL